MLIKKYTELVNHLWLFLGTGMTVRAALSLYAHNDNREDMLAKEISYTLSLIESGEDEVIAYEELAKRLGIIEYNRLFTHIGQNIRMGTKDIRNIMEDELEQAISVRRELSKQKGEEASAKLVFPMVLMLGVVMIIVMVPALVGFI